MPHRVLRFVLLASCAFAACSPRAADRPPPARNLVFLFVDTLRADHLGAWGWPRATSPAMDRFAATGFLCDSAYVRDGWKLVRDDSTGVEELYDLAADPSERRDLSRDDPRRAAGLADLPDDRIDVAGENPFVAPRAALTERQIERLRALGYAGGGS